MVKTILQGGPVQWGWITTGRMRDLSGVVPDIAGAGLAPESLAKLASIDPDRLPLASPIIRS